MKDIIETLQQYGVFFQENSFQKLHGGKDNATYLATLTDGKKIIVQHMKSVKNQEHADFLSSVISWVVKNYPEMNFVPNVGNLKRFYPVSTGFIQIMSVVEGKNALDFSMNVDFIQKIAKRLGKFHKNMQNFSLQGLSEINYHRDRVHIFREQAEQFMSAQKNTELHQLIAEYAEKFQKIRINTENLRKGIIHGDPIVKNFLIDDSGEIVAWIDYDMLSYTYQIWDLADMYRGYAKNPEFSAEYAKKLLEAYESENPLTDAERQNLPDCIRMMTLDTGYRYILAMDESSQFSNSLGDSLEKANRCLSDYERVSEWF